MKLVQNRCWFTKSRVMLGLALITSLAALLYSNMSFPRKVLPEVAIHGRHSLRVLEICQGRQVYSFHISSPSYWTVVVTVNSGYLDHFRNWWYYFQRLNIDVDLIAVAEDENAFQSLLVMDLDGAIILNAGSNATDMAAFSYNSRAYNKLVSSRPSRLLSILCSPFPLKNLIYADVDAVWLKDPIPYVQEALHDGGKLDLVSQDDNPNSALAYCTGFMGMKCNDGIMNVLALWEHTLANENNFSKPNQQLFVNTLQDPAVSSMGFKHGKLPLMLFPPGNIYFHPDTTAEQRNKAVVVHNNWIVGSYDKTERFKKWNLWQV